MDVAASLDKLRQSFPTCDAAALIDLSASMVLSTSASVRMSQEKWDDLCASAREALVGQDATVAQTILDAGQPISTAVMALEDFFVVSIASGTDRDLALCAMCAGKVDLDALVAAADVTLSEITQNG